MIEEEGEAWSCWFELKIEVSSKTADSEEKTRGVVWIIV
jgi:hypothetical protein